MSDIEVDLNEIEVFAGWIWHSDNEISFKKVMLIVVQLNFLKGADFFYYAK
jgi:hypothetical protein